MSGLFSDVLMSNESIFKNEDVLDPSFFPPDLPGRENEIKVLAESVKPLFYNSKSSNLFIYGLPGVGKTVSANHVVNQLNEASEEIKTIFINCWNNQTSHSIILEIAKEVGLVFPRKGVPTDEIIMNVMNKLLQKKGVLLILDEVDKLKEQDVLYSLLERLGKRACVFMITNNKEFIKSLEPRLTSRLNLNMLEFAPYNILSTKKIIKQRADLALRKGVLSDEALTEVVKIAFKTKDIRKGLFALLEAGKTAEKDASKKITPEHVAQAISRLANKATNEEEKLSEDEKKIYELIKAKQGLLSGELFSEYKKINGGLSQRSFRRYINRLEKYKLIRTEITGEGFKGKSRKIYTQ